MFDSITDNSSSMCGVFTRALVVKSENPLPMTLEYKDTDQMHSPRTADCTRLPLVSPPITAIGIIGGTLMSTPSSVNLDLSRSVHSLVMGKMDGRKNSSIDGTTHILLMAEYPFELFQHTAIPTVSSNVNRKIL